MSIDPHSSHDCGNQRYLAIPWMDECLSMRLPTSAGNELRSMPENGHWLAPLLGTDATQASDYQGKPLEANGCPASAPRWLGCSTRKTRRVRYYATARTQEHPRARQRSALGSRSRFGKRSRRIYHPSRQARNSPVTREQQEPFGRPIFQKNSYSDTPSQPLAQMQYEDKDAPAGSHFYEVIAINSVGLTSDNSPIR